MITRHTAVSVSGTAQNARQRLGEVIKFHREHRGKNVREISRRLKISVADVESLEAGRLQPSADEWKGLCNGISRQLNAYNDLRLQACAERDAEQLTITRSITMHTTSNGHTNNHKASATTNIGAKLAAAVSSSSKPAPDSPTAPTTPKAEPAPAPIERIDTMAETQRPAGTRVIEQNASEQLGIPVRGYASDGRKLSPVRPEGADQHDARSRRRMFVRDLLTKYPNKRTSGADSVIEHVRKAFGIGVSPEAVEIIREELRSERIKAEIMSQLPPLVGRIEPPIPTKPFGALAETRTPEQLRALYAPDAEPAPTGEVNAADLEAAVQLVLGAVPGLQTFTISVDEHGEASVDYQVRKVVVTTTGGSLKVRR